MHNLRVLNQKRTHSLTHTHAQGVYVRMPAIVPHPAVGGQTRASYAHTHIAHCVAVLANSSLLRRRREPVVGANFMRIMCGAYVKTNYCVLQVGVFAHSARVASVCQRVHSPT